MRHAVRAIVVRDNHLLVMRRDKFGQQYFTLVGGRIDPHETPHQALLREVHEETGLVVAHPRQVYIEYAGVPFGVQHIYLCDYVSGEPKLHPHSEEAAINALGRNLHEPMWISLNSLKDLPFRSRELKAELLIGLKKGWPETPKEIHWIEK